MALFYAVRISDDSRYHRVSRMPESVPQTEPQGFRVSVVVVAYNQIDATRRAVEALQKSTMRDRTEILVVDCASTDGTASLDRDFPAINMLRLPHHMGAGRALNIATRTAKADLLFFLSPDVEVVADTVEVLTKGLDADVDTVAACPLLTDASGIPTPHIYKLPDASAILAAARGGELTSSTPDLAQGNPAIDYPALDALLVRKQFVVAMNYFDQRYGHYWVDAEFAMQARRAGKKIRIYPAARAIYHPAPDPLEGDSLAAADRILGAAEYAAKYGGSGLGLRVGAAFGALAKFDFSRFLALAGGQKLDGSQT
jgi:GT2 family glycosyltransferase